jgi:hypothetical protein
MKTGREFDELDNMNADYLNIVMDAGGPQPPHP